MGSLLVPYHPLIQVCPLTPSLSEYRKQQMPGKAIGDGLQTELSKQCDNWCMKNQESNTCYKHSELHTEVNYRTGVGGFF